MYPRLQFRPTIYMVYYPGHTPIDRDFVRNLINRISGDNQIIHNDRDDCLRVIQLLSGKYKLLFKEYKSALVRNKELEKEVRQLKALQAFPLSR